MATAARESETSELPRPGSPRLPRSTVLWYGVGQAAEGIKNYAFTSILLFYYTSVLGLSGKAAGLALMVALVFDAITDPLVAVLSDRTHSRWGRRHPFIFLSAFPLGLCFYLTFLPPQSIRVSAEAGNEAMLFAWLTSFAIATRAAMTLFHVPHMALGAELSDDFDERTRVVTARSLWAVVGTTACVTGYFVLLGMNESAEYPDVRLNPAPYGLFAAVCALAITLVVFATAWGTRDRIPKLLPPDEQATANGVFASLVGDMRETLGLRSFRALFFGFTLCNIGWGVTGALGAHNALYLWHISLEVQGLVGLMLVLGIGTGMAFWKQVADRTDKRPTFIIGLFWFLAFSAPPSLAKALGFFPSEDSVVYIPLLMGLNFLAAFGISSSMVVVGSMMADITDEDELRHGRRREGIFFGSLSFAGKAAGGVGTVIAGATYDLVGLYKGLDPATAAPEITVRLGLVSGGIMLLLVGLSFTIFRRYDLTRVRVGEIQGALAAR